MKILFNIILIVTALIVFVPSFRRFLFWILVGRQLVKDQNKANQNIRREGEVRVEKNGNTPPDTRFKGGEYVDYEEVKE